MRENDFRRLKPVIRSTDAGIDWRTRMDKVELCKRNITRLLRIARHAARNGRMRRADWAMDNALALRALLRGPL